MSKKELDQIKPARGAVKLKNKKPPKRKPEQPPRVMQDVGAPEMVEESGPPSHDAIQVMQQLNVHKEDLIRAMKEFNSALNDSTLKENKSSKQTQNEQSLVNNLAKSAASINNISPGEGSIGLCVFALRQALSLRDAGNSLAYKIDQLSKRIDGLQPLENKALEEKKRKLKELADELGVDILKDKD